MSSCRLPMGALHKTHITTVEGVGTSKQPHPIQQRLFECHAVQCGYDTPGFVVAAYALLVQNTYLKKEDIVKGLDGVFSRCNGYRAVVEALESFVGETGNERKNLEEKLPTSLAERPKYPITFQGVKNSWSLFKYT